MNPYRILVVDDEEDLCEILQFNLETEGYVVEVAYSAEEALKLDVSSFHLILLDVMMGEMSGFKMARLLRDNSQTAKIPIIFLTARDTENDKLTGFNIGADDYIPKPFSIREVVARVKAVIRRYAAPEEEKPEDKLLMYDGLVMNLGNKKVVVDGEEVQFTKKEFEILRLFLEYRNRVFTRDEILSRVWTEDVIVLDRTIDVNITRLRKKVGQYGKNIVTRLGYGYCFES
ncbi:Transcriptional regulatory protein WalR [bioreactor metagenome]|jgi:DNA-binding response OmpR family regulator|uniref:Transcriptional regulatory protein WalR n=1 Tax=bioreactor metagenome TaxID=1076179 RepID=A0A644US22_9ZZZZ|nr:response regulator transcription factor [Paludibacter sp.]